jgi:hypothetical protein
MSIMAQEEKEVSLLETALAGLASDQETEEEVKEGTDITGVDETKVYKVWEEDEEDQDAGEEEEVDSTDDEEDVEEMDHEGDSDSEEEDEVDTDEVEVSADDAEEDMEAEVEDEEEPEEGYHDEDEDGEESEEEEEAEEGVHSEEEDEDEVEEGSHEEDEEGEAPSDEEGEESDEVEGDEEVEEEEEDDVGQAIEQISKTITAAATHKAMEKIEASYGSMKEDIDALCAEDDSLTEEFKTKAATIFEAAVGSKVKEQVQDIKESYVDYIKEEVETLNQNLVDNIDSYLTYVAEQWISKNDVAISNVLRTEIAEDFMSSLKNIFMESYVEMPEGKTDMFDEVTQKNSELTESVEAKDKELKSLSEEIVSLKKSKVVSDLSEGLASTQVAKFKKLTEDIEWTDEESFLKKAAIVKESYFSKKSKPTKVETKSEKSNSQTKSVVVVEEVKEENSLDPIMASYIKAASKLEDEAFGKE